MSNPIVLVSHLSKKFTRDFGKSLRHGASDILRRGLGFERPIDHLRQDEFWALEDISIEVSKGEILGVIGRNGSGKTTLMRIVAGIYPADKGIVKTAGKILAMFAIKSGMQPQLTGRENIYLKSYMLNIPKEEVDRNIDKIIAFADIADSIDNVLGSYSMGMRSRLAFAIATCAKPDIFIIDEGLAVGDHAFRLQCFDYLKSISAEVAILFVTNNVKQAEMLATKILVLNKGKTVFMSADVKQGVDQYLQLTLPKSTLDNHDGLF